eukprot:6228725-Pyramimonas_sp.AAC.1
MKQYSYAHKRRCSNKATYKATTRPVQLRIAEAANTTVDSCQMMGASYCCNCNAATSRAGRIICPINITHRPRHHAAPYRPLRYC